MSIDPDVPAEHEEPERPGAPGEAGEPEQAAKPEEREERRYPSTIGGAFYIGVLVAAGIGIALVALDDWRVGVRVIAASLASAGLVRLVLPQRDAGMLAVRHRAFDVVLLVGVAAALYFLAGDIPDQPV